MIIQISRPILSDFLSALSDILDEEQRIRYDEEKKGGFAAMMDGNTIMSVAKAMELLQLLNQAAECGHDFLFVDLRNAAFSA